MTEAPRDDLLPQRADGLGAGMSIALAVHLGLVAAIAIGVNWRSYEPEAVSAELWAAVPQTAAPRAADPTPPPPPPPPAPPPRPAPPPPPPPPPPQRTVEPQPSRDAEIAIEKAKREQDARELREQQEARKKEQERREQEETRRKEEQQRKDEQRREEARKREEEKERKEADQRRVAEEKEKREQQAREAAERKRQEAEAQKKREAEEARQAAARKEMMARMQGMAGASGDERATGSAMQSSGPSAGYAGRVRAKVKPNITYSDDVPGNPVAEVEVRLAPDGTIIGTPRLVKRSGVASWDEAVLRAVAKTEVFPKDVDGRVPSPMVISFRPRD